MDAFNTIDIEGKTLALSEKELLKLTTPEGCRLEVVTDKILKMDDQDDDDLGSDHEDSFYIDDCDTDYETTKKAKEDRMRREYINLVLNANNDPIKPGTKYKTQNFCELEANLDFDIDNLTSDSYLGIHRMYEDLGNFEEYLKKHPFEDIVPGLIYKCTRVPGAGKHAQVGEDSLVIYNCALWTENSKEPFDSSWLRRTTMMSHLATDTLLPGIRELLLGAQERELFEALLRPEVAFGKLGVMPRIAPNATIFCLLQVVRVVPQDKVAKLLKVNPQAENVDLQSNDDGLGIIPGCSSTLTFEDYYEASDESRRRGNYFFQNDQYKVASQRYKSAIRLLEGLSYKNEQEEKRAKDLLIKLYNNCARTSNAMGNPRAALAACKQASLIDDYVPKTYWHRMSAWASKGHFDRALGVARRAVQLFPDPQISAPFSKTIESYKYKLQQEQIEVDKLQKLMGRALLSSS